jgi:hypothetical protein
MTTCAIFLACVLCLWLPVTLWAACALAGRCDDDMEGWDD